MDIFVNNQKEVISASDKLSNLLASIHLQEKRGIAVAVNNYVIPKPEWGNYELKENDKVTIIHATQGG